MGMDHLGAEWLGDEAGFVRKCARAGSNMSRCDDERDVWPGVGNFASQCEAVQRSRHLHIREEQGDIGVPCSKKVECRITVISLEHLEPSLFEDVDRVQADHEVIIHHKRERMA